MLEEKKNTVQGTLNLFLIKKCITQQHRESAVDANNPRPSTSVNKQM